MNQYLLGRFRRKSLIFFPKLLYLTSMKRSMVSYFSIIIDLIKIPQWVIKFFFNAWNYYYYFFFFFFFFFLKITFFHKNQYFSIFFLLFSLRFIFRWIFVVGKFGGFAIVSFIFIFFFCFLENFLKYFLLLLIFIFHLVYFSSFLGHGHVWCIFHRYVHFDLPNLLVNFLKYFLRHHFDHFHLLNLLVNFLKYFLHHLKLLIYFLKYFLHLLIFFFNLRLQVVFRIF